MNNIRTVIPLAEFKSQLKFWLEHLRKFKSPILVSRHGHGEFVVQRVESYAQMSDLAIECRHRICLDQALSEKESLVPSKNE